MPADRSTTWDGGYIRQNKKGGKVFVIYKRIDGRLYEVSTRCTSTSAAEIQWRRFQSNPLAYSPAGEAPREGLTLSVTLAADFLSWSRDKGNTPAHVHHQRDALAWWHDQLGPVDLRRVGTSLLAEKLIGEACLKQKIATLKTFYAWLRETRHLITTPEDPTYGQLKVPQSRPKQLTQIKAVTQAQFRATLRNLKGWHRDALQVLGGTGWHWTELARFVVSGRVEKHPQTSAGVLLCPHTKGGVPLRTEVSEATVKAARRLRERSAIDYFEFRHAIRKAGGKFNPGFLRHSVATWAINAGADPAQVAAFLGHKSPSTTKRFYATHAVPARVPTISG